MSKSNILFITGVSRYIIFFFFNDTATTEIYTLSLHDALPICTSRHGRHWPRSGATRSSCDATAALEEDRPGVSADRSEAHTSELQSQSNLVCRLLLETKDKKDRRAELVTVFRTVPTDGYVCAF